MTYHNDFVVGLDDERWRHEIHRLPYPMMLTVLKEIDYRPSHGNRFACSMMIYSSFDAMTMIYRACSNCRSMLILYDVASQQKQNYFFLFKCFHTKMANCQVCSLQMQTTYCETQWLMMYQLRVVKPHHGFDMCTPVTY